MSPHFHNVIRSDRATGEPPAVERRTATNTRGSRRGYRAAKAAHSAFLSGMRGVIALVTEDKVDNILCKWYDLFIK